MMMIAVQSKFSWNYYYYYFEVLTRKQRNILLCAFKMHLQNEECNSLNPDNDNNNMIVIIMMIIICCTWFLFLFVPTLQNLCVLWNLKVHISVLWNAGMNVEYFEYNWVAFHTVTKQNWIKSSLYFGILTLFK